MKPILLEIQAFGPYADRQTVDFAKLTQAGIFLIKGPTGSGKTTIFDAMMFALYGGSSGSEAKDKMGRNDLEEWRCNQADSKLSTEVAFTFSIAGRTYRFIRRMVPKRTKLSAEYMAGELDEDGTLIPFFENPKKDDLTRKAEELIGLTREQFRQVILLPQGQFERFLTAGSDEKEEILKLIFDTRRWERYAEQFFSAASERKNALLEEKRAIDLALAEEGICSLDELAEKIAQTKENIEQNQAARQEYDAEKKQAELNRDIQLAERFKPLHDLEKKSALLASRQEEYARMGAKYKRAENAETLRTLIEQTETQDAEQLKWKKRLDDSRLALPRAKDLLAAAQKKKADHDANDPTQELMAQVGSLQEKRSAYQTINELRDKCRLADSISRRAELTAKNMTGLVERALDAFKASNQKMVDKEKIAADCRSRYFAGICGELAQQLEENAPCPVCGSRSHPQPARKAPDSVSKADMEKAEQEAEKAKNAWKLADQNREDAEEKKNAAVQALTDAQSSVIAAKTSLQHAEASLIPGVPDLSALDAAVQKLKNDIQAYRVAGDTLQKTIDQYNSQLSAAQANLESCEASCQEAAKKYTQSKAMLDSALTEKGYSAVRDAKQDLLPYAERQKMNSSLSSYKQSADDTRRELEKVQQELAGMQEPDQAGFLQRQREIRETSDQFSRLDAQLHNTEKRLQDKQKKLREKNTHFAANYQQAEDDLVFARKLRGDSGVGMHRYILSVMFSQMLGEANRMLSKVHGGRYQLHQTFEKSSGNKRGLNLKVYDNRSPETEGRNVAMLSGGEKFLVSLSLSIGISAVAQSSGIRIETLFIDEGFGTLDNSSINDAMDILESVRKSSGMIGIISHVPLLESNIPVHLEVVKTNSGSSILPV